MIKFIKRWYQGEYYSLSNQGIFPGNRYKRHWSSRLAHTLIEFYLKEWKWLLPFIVSLIAILIALKEL